MSKATFTVGLAAIIVLLVCSVFFIVWTLRSGGEPLSGKEQASSEQQLPMGGVVEPPDRTETGSGITPEPSQPGTWQEQEEDTPKVLLTDEEILRLEGMSFPLSRDEEAHAYERELVDMPSYTIQFDGSDQTFIIALREGNISEIRMSAEVHLASILRVSVPDLCNYKVIVVAFPTAERPYNPDVGLSGCPGTR